MTTTEEHSPQQFPQPEHRQFTNFLSGLVAGLISVTACNPLDIARTRLNMLNAPCHESSSGKYTHFTHAMSTIWKQQGFKGFYSGYRTNIVAVPIFHSIFFPIYEYLKEKALANDFSLFQASLVSTASAGTICNIITNPIWVVRTRLMAQYLHHETNHYKSTAPFAVMQEIYKAEGFLSLFKGLTASLFSVSNAMIYFSLYEKIKQTLGPDTIWHIFVASTAAKVVASTLTYPIVVVRTVMFDYRGKQQSHFQNIVRHILNKNGIAGFYSGLKPDLIRLVPSNAIIFIVYETLKKYL